jgi:putative endonuclease
MRKYHYYVYILTNHTGTLYTGVTNNLVRRLDEHRRGVGSKFAAKYNIKRLVHFEVYQDVQDAIAREKEIKSWRREKKVTLIEQTNPEWKDLSAEWED